MKINLHKLIREARELLNSLPVDAATRADLGVLVMQWDSGERSIDGAELLVAVLDGHEELTAIRELCATAA